MTPGTQSGPSRVPPAPPTGLNPSPPITKDKDLTATVPAAREPALTQPPSPATPPPPPAEGDRYTALAYLAGGITPEEAAARAGTISGWVARRTSDGLQLLTADDLTVRYLEVMLDELAAERHARAVRLAADMKALAGEGWTRETARAALALPEPVAA
jgi:hypothetical protein